MPITSLSVNLVKKNPAGDLVCDAKCPQCIAKATWDPGFSDNKLIVNNFDKALDYATWHRIDSIVFTGKVEPCLCDELSDLVNRAKKAGIPSRELQSNGRILCRYDYQLLKRLAAEGLTCLAISVNHYDPVKNSQFFGFTENYNYFDLITAAKQLGLLVRVSFNLTKDCFDEQRLWKLHQGNDRKIKTHFLEETFIPWLKKLQAHGVDQLTLRTMGKALNPIKTAEARCVSQWVDDHPFDPYYKKLIDDFVEREDHPIVDQLYYGPYVHNVYDMMVVGTTCKDEEVRNPGDVRGVVLQSDGLIHVSWDYKSPRL